MSYTPLEPIIRASRGRIELDPNKVYSFPGVAQNNDPNRCVIPDNTVFEGNNAVVYIEPPEGSYDIDSLYADAPTNVEINRVTLRVSDKVVTTGPNKRLYKINGIWVQGNGSTKSCVLGGLYGNKSNDREAFGFKITGQGSIMNCHMYNLTGDYHTCLALGRGKIGFNNIIAEPATGRYSFAINLGNSYDVVAHNNTIEGIFTAFYIDWKNSIDCRAYRNDVKGCRKALYIKTQQTNPAGPTSDVSDIYLLDNEFRFHPEVLTDNNQSITNASALVVENTRLPWSDELAYQHSVKNIHMRYNKFFAHVDRFYLANLASNNNRLPGTNFTGVHGIHLLNNTVFCREDTELYVRNYLSRAHNVGISVTQDSTVALFKHVQ